MSAALDLGTSRLRSLRHENDRLLARGCRSEYLVMEELPAVRRVLDLANVAYARCEGAVMLLGDCAGEYASIFGVPCHPVFPQGRIPRNDPPARQALAAMIEGLLPDPSEPGEICCMTISGIAANDEGTPRQKRRYGRSQILALRVFERVGAKGWPGLGLAEWRDAS